MHHGPVTQPESAMPQREAACHRQQEIEYGQHRPRYDEPQPDVLRGHVEGGKPTSFSGGFKFHRKCLKACTHAPATRMSGASS